MLGRGYRVDELESELESDAGGEPGPQDPLVGKRFGAYHVFKKVGGNALADTYWADWLGNRGRRTPVTLEIIREEVSRVEGFSKVFAEQARISAMPQHPNLNRTCDYGNVAGRFFLANEYSSGRRLDLVLQGLRRLGVQPGLKFSVALVRDVARTLGASRALRESDGSSEIVHGDIRPSNISVVHRAKSHLLGIGLARLARAIGWPASVEGPCIYMAPEQLTGSPVDPRTDVFSLGIILWELFTGEPLFYGHSPPDALWSVLHGDVFPPSLLAPQIPLELDCIVLTALSADPARRYASPAKLAAELSSVRMATRRSDAFIPLRRVAQGPRAEQKLLILPRRRFELLN
jgi:serine/threonine-protein kinase